MKTCCLRAWCALPFVLVALVLLGVGEAFANVGVLIEGADEE
jgi:hypothetical protein